MVSEHEQRKSVNHCFAVTSPDGALQLMVGQLDVDALPTLQMVNWWSLISKNRIQNNSTGMLGDVKRSTSSSLPPFEWISTSAGRLVQVIVSPGMFRTLFSHESVRHKQSLSDNSVVEQ